MRTKLKSDIRKERGSRCPLTGRKGTDLHEVFITRADYPFPEKQHLIFVRENCVLLDHTRHLNPQKGDRYKLGMMLISRYGIARIERWAMSLHLKTWKGLAGLMALLETRRE